MSASDLIDSLMEIHPKGFDLSLDRIGRLLEALGSPHLNIPPAIHVAGTNGKGSTIAYCRAILEAGGKSAHVHTSPHLVSWHERFRLGARPSGQFVSDEKLENAIARAADANGGKNVTVFEILSAATFLLFHENPSDYSLIEVGLGGRFDATNVIEKPAVCVIAPIDLDHQAYLGDTLGKIAFEKAGIIKQGSTVVCAPQHDEAYEVIAERCDALNANLISAQREYDFYEQNGRFIYQDEMGLLDLCLPNLVGDHQLMNASLAIAAIRAIEPEFSNAVYEEAMQSVVWPARMQRLSSGNIVEQIGNACEFWLDGGHNPAAGKVVASELQRQNAKKPMKTIMVCAMLNTKEPVGYFEALADFVSEIICVPIISSDAGIEPDELANYAQTAGIKSRSMASLEEAVSALEVETKKEPARVLLAGSLYLAGDVLALNETPPQ